MGKEINLSKHPKKEDLFQGLSEEQLDLTPMCTKCGWRKGGKDSWDGKGCKCGHTSPTFRTLFTPKPSGWADEEWHPGREADLKRLHDDQ